MADARVRRTIGAALLVGTVLSGTVGTGARADAAPAPANRARACGRIRAPLRAGANTLVVGGSTRAFLVALPRGYRGRTRAPVILDFHGFLSSGPQLESDTSMGVRGAARGFVVVTPTSLGDPPQWNEFAAPDQADDYGFVTALLADVETHLCVDPARVFAAGHSNGSAFAAILVCRAPYPFAAVAMVSATTPSTCPATVTPAALAIAGTADASVPYNGGVVGGSSIQIPAAAATMAAYAQRYGCATGPSPVAVAPGVTRVRYAKCRNRSRVVLDTVAGGTHPWPGGAAAAADAGDSAAGRTFDATGEILTFFAHR